MGTVKDMGKMQSSESQTTRVIFQIFSPMLNLNDLSKNIHLKPDHTHLLGDYPRANPKYAPYKHGMWLLRSKISDKLSLEAHLENLISILEPYQDYIRILSENNKVHFACVLHCQNGFEISPSILARMSKLGASFGAEIYPPDTENENDSQLDPHH
jgi:hypothetical protein